MGTSQRQRYWKDKNDNFIKKENGNMERHIFIFKRVEYNLKRNKRKTVTRTFDKEGNKKPETGKKRISMKILLKNNT